MRKLLICVSFTLLLFIFAGPGANAEESKGTPEARVELVKGEKLAEKGEMGAAVEAFGKAIELDPNFARAHDSFIETTRMYLGPEIQPEGYEKYRAAQTGKLIGIYSKWAKKYPKTPSIFWGLAQLYETDNYAKAKANLEIALKLDPKFARAWQTFALIADVSGDPKKQTEYYKRAADSEPGDPSYLFYYGNTLRRTDPVRFEKISIEVADKFPTHFRGAQALYWLGYETSSSPDKSRSVLERLIRQYPVNDFSWSASGAQLLYGVYSKDEPEKALSFASDLAKQFKDEADKKTWQGIADYQQTINEAAGSIKEGKFASASAVLEKVVAPRSIGSNDLEFMKIEALVGAGQFQTAYDNTVKQFVKAPTDKLAAKMNVLGAKLGKTPVAIEKDLKMLLDAQLKPAKTLKLYNYATGKEVSLEDFRGKVVLLNFWYPYCGPCRGENPTLDRVQRKVGRDKFVILAVNVHPPEDEYVMPYMKGMKFDFVPLRGSSEFAEKEWAARGYPTNYLIDPEGRVGPRVGSVVGAEQERTFELQIRLMLGENK